MSQHRLVAVSGLMSPSPKIEVWLELPPGSGHDNLYPEFHAAIMQQNRDNQWDCSGEWTKEDEPISLLVFRPRSHPGKRWIKLQHVKISALFGKAASVPITSNVGSELSLHTPGLHYDNAVAGGTHYNLASVTKFQPVKAHGIHHRPLPHSSLLILYLHHLTNPIIVQCDSEICCNHLGSQWHIL